MKLYLNIQKARHNEMQDLKMTCVYVYHPPSEAEKHRFFFHLTNLSSNILPNISKRKNILNLQKHSSYLEKCNLK